MSEPTKPDPNAETVALPVPQPLSQEGEDLLASLSDAMTSYNDGTFSAPEPDESQEEDGTGHQLPEDSTEQDVTPASQPINDVQAGQAAAAPFLVPTRDFQVGGVVFPMGIPMERSTILHTLRDDYTLSRFIKEGLLVPHSG